MIQNIAIAGVFLFCFAFQAIKAQDTNLLKQFVLSAEGPTGITGLISSTIDSSQLELETSTSLGDLLQKHTAIFVKDYGPSGIQTVTFRGMSASHTQVYVNGLEMGSPTLGQTDFSIVPSFLVNQIGIKNGNAAFSEGAGAIGGGVLIQNEGKRYATPQILLGSTIGSFGNYQGFSSVGWSKNKWSFTTKMIYQQAKNNFPFTNISQPNAPEQVTKNAQKKMLGFSQQIDFNKSKNSSFFGNFMLVSANRNLPGLMTQLSASKESQEDVMSINQLGWKYFKGKVQSKLVAGYTYGQLIYESPIADIHSNTTTHMMQIRNDFTYRLNHLFQFKSTVNAKTAYALSPTYGTENKQNQVSALMGVNYKIHPKLESGIFVQPVWNNSNYRLLPMVSLAYLPLKSERLILGANWAQNTHFPSLNDLYWVPGGNPDLAPEDAWNAEINVTSKWNSFKGWNIELVGGAYYGEVKNWILWQPGNGNYWEAQNVKNVDHYGVELDVRVGYQLQKSTFSYIGKYQNTQAINQGGEQASNQKQLIYTPKNQMSNIFMFEGYNTMFQCSHSFNGMRYTASDNSSFLPSYQLVDLMVGYQFTRKNFQKFSIQLDVKNIFDVGYMSVLWRAMPGRNFLITCKYQWN